MPCGATNIPEPKLFRTLPLVSSLKITSIFLISRVWGSRQLLTPQRSATHTDTPSLSMSTALVEPIFRPSGSFTQCSIVINELGSSLVGSLVSGDVFVSTEAPAAIPPKHPVAITVAKNKLTIRHFRGINEPP